VRTTSHTRLGNCAEVSMRLTLRGQLAEWSIVLYKTATIWDSPGRPQVVLEDNWQSGLLSSTARTLRATRTKKRVNPHVLLTVGS